MHIGFIISTVCLIIAAFVLWIGTGMGTSQQGDIAVLAMLGYMFGFAIGVGNVCWVIMSEVLPTKIRSKAFGLFLPINWSCALIVGLLTLSAVDGLGGYRSSMSDDEQLDAQQRGVGIILLICGGLDPEEFNIKDDRYTNNIITSSSNHNLERTTDSGRTRRTTSISLVPIIYKE